MSETINLNTLDFNCKNIDRLVLLNFLKAARCDWNSSRTRLDALDALKENGFERESESKISSNGWTGQETIARLTKGSAGHIKDTIQQTCTDTPVNGEQMAMLRPMYDRLEKLISDANKE